MVKLFKPTYTKHAAGIFLGVQGFIRKNQYTSSVDYNNGLDGDENLSYYDEFGVRKTAKGLNLIFGYQYAKRRIVIEPFIGFGFIHKKIKNTNRQFNTVTQVENENIDAVLPGFYLAEDSGTYGNFTAGFRLGYQL